MRTYKPKSAFTANMFMLYIFFSVESSSVGSFKDERSGRGILEKADESKKGKRNSRAEVQGN